MVIADEIRMLRASRLGLVDIATRLNDQGLKTRRGTAWQFQYVAAVLNQRAVVVAAR
jgi:hypothetical protein